MPANHTEQEFFDLAIRCGALRFGEFTLKSGRVSPYFFNAAAFTTGAAMARLGELYAQAIDAQGLAYDMLFGPAYKGIPLAVAVAIGAANRFGIDKPFAFNRKEAKDHGEGGTIVGPPLCGRILVVDDVISAGTSVGESVALIEAAGARLAGVAIALDREERGQNERSAVNEIEARHGVPVIRLARLSGLLAYLETRAGLDDHVPAIRTYRARYGVPG
ncbi:MAG: orotate phosphoribosyltransferase [Gammaproteobacteria bacterium]|nr:orotate phosphoribosyltransferase [Gammaproteobacteria bacterium]